MRIEILDQAEKDLIEGFHFYEAQETGLIFSGQPVFGHRIVSPLRWCAPESIQTLPSPLVPEISVRRLLPCSREHGVHSRGSRLSS